MKNARRILSITFLSISILLLSHCSSQDGAPSGYIDVSRIPDARPRNLPRSRYGNPDSYVALGRRYHVHQSARGYHERGIASWYGTKFQGQLTSSREPYNLYAMTAAHKTLPIPCFVRVTNLENGRSVIVKVNDRGPFVSNRIIDLSYAAAKKLGYQHKGTALVDVQAVMPGETVQAPRYHSEQPQLYLQLGAFSQRHNATQLRDRLRRRIEGRTIAIQRAGSWSSPLFRVRIGPLVGVGESDKLKDYLENHGFGEPITVIK